MRSTHTYALLAISGAAFAEISAKLSDAGYGHAFDQDGNLDMHGIALTREPGNDVVETRSTGWMTVNEARAAGALTGGSAGSALDRRFFDAEIRIEQGDDGKPKLVGKGAPFMSLSKPLTLKKSNGDTVQFREQIDPGAFDDSLREGNEQLLLHGHDPHKALARRSAGTMRISKRDDGLYFEGDLADTTLARDTAADVNHKNIKGASIGFGSAVVDKWEKKNGENIRTLLKVPLREISVTTIPAYEDTAVENREAELAIEKLSGLPEGTEVRCGEHRSENIRLSSVTHYCRSTMGSCRDAYDAMERTIEHLGEHKANKRSLDEHEARNLRDLMRHVKHLTGKAAEMREAITALDAGTEPTDGPNQGNANGGNAAQGPNGSVGAGPRDDVAGDSSDTPLDQGADPLRAEFAKRQRIQQAADMELRTSELRASAKNAA